MNLGYIFICLQIPSKVKKRSQGNARLYCFIVFIIGFNQVFF